MTCEHAMVTDDGKHCRFCGAHSGTVAHEVRLRVQRIAPYINPGPYIGEPYPPLRLGGTLSAPPIEPTIALRE